MRFMPLLQTKQIPSVQLESLTVFKTLHTGVYGQFTLLNKSSLITPICTLRNAAFHYLSMFTFLSFIIDLIVIFYTCNQYNSWILVLSYALCNFTPPLWPQTASSLEVILSYWTMTDKNMNKETAGHSSLLLLCHSSAFVQFTKCFMTVVIVILWAIYISSFYFLF